MRVRCFRRWLPACAEAEKKQNIKLPLPVKRSVLSMVLQVQPALPYAMTAAKLQHGFRAAGEHVVNMLSQCTSWQHLTDEEKAKVEEAVPKCVQYMRYGFSLLLIFLLLSSLTCFIRAEKTRTS